LYPAIACVQGGERFSPGLSDLPPFQITANQAADYLPAGILGKFVSGCFLYLGLTFLEMMK